LIIVFQSLLFPSNAQDQPDLLENSIITGYVKDEESGDPLIGVTVKVERDFYIGNLTVTNDTGFYKLRIPGGNFILRIFDSQGFVIFRTNFTIKYHEDLRLDFVLDSHDIAQSSVFGTIRNQITYTPMVEADIKIRRTSASGDMVLYRETETDSKGDFSIKLPAGDYEFEVWADDEKIFKEEFELFFGEEKKFDLVLQQPSRNLNFQNILKLIFEQWLNIIVMIIVLVIGLLMNGFMDRAFTNAKKTFAEKPGRFIDLPIIRFIERVVKWNIFIIILIIIVFLLAQILDLVTLIWIPLSNSVASIYLIILLVIFMRIGLMIWNQFISYLKGSEEQKPKRILSSRIIAILDIIGKYTLSFFFLLGILVTAFAALGMSDIIIGGFTEGLAKNAGFIIFIVTLMVLTWVIVRFLTSFFQDMKTRTTRFRPEMIEIAGKGIKFLVYGIIGLIIAFTLLSAAGLGEIGQTIIIVFSMILGLVVSMAATGSIGNILSGIVIMSFKPFEEGDYVIIAEKHIGQIIETNIMFTKLRDLENEIVEIPNNIVLAGCIVNWTDSAKSGGFAVEIEASIGYDVPARQVIYLMKESCKDLPAVLEFPKPNVIITGFQNHAIGYKLRAYIKSPQIRFKIQTEIMINIQKKFTEAGVEVLSPEFYVKRTAKIPTPKAIKGRLKKIKKFDKQTS
jgi:small-conductance mechanosensitive channel